MARYCKFETETGAIIAVSISEREPSLPNGYGYIEISDTEPCDPAFHYVVDSALIQRVEITSAINLSPVISEQACNVDVGLPSDISIIANGNSINGNMVSVAVGAKTTVEAVGRYKGTWDIVPRTIEQLRLAKRGELNDARTAMELGGCMTPFGKRVDTDDRATKRISGGVQMAMLAQMTGAPYAETWTMEDDTDQDIDAQGMISIGIALAMNTRNAFAICKDLKALLDIAETEADIAAIVWPTDA